MPSYIVETFLARGATGERQALERRVAEAVESLARTGTRVRFLGLVHVPDDELCLFTFEARTRSVAIRAATRAGLEPLRTVKVMSSASLGSDPTTREG